MRKQTFFYIMFCVTLLLYFLLPNTSCVFNDNIGNNKRYFFYAKVVNENINNNCSVVKNGNAFIISCDYANRASVKKMCTDVLGESVNFFGDETDLYKILNYYSAEVVMTDCLGNTQIYYCFSSILGEGLYVYDNLINMQIAITQNNYTIGFPIILGSY